MTMLVMTIWMVLGVALIGVTFWDVFLTLFHPIGHGTLTGVVSRLLWRMFRRLARQHPDILVLAGPFAMLSVMFLWGILLTLGWAFLIWPFFPEGFLIADELDLADDYSFLTAIYVSLVTLVTLGYGDVTPQAPILRIIVPLEALVGFGLLTAAISWLLALYPVVSRRRAFARELSLLREAETETGIDPLAGEAALAIALLSRLTSQTIEVTGDLIQHPISYYFESNDPRSALFPELRTIDRLATAATHPLVPDAVRLRGVILTQALHDLVTELSHHGNYAASGTLDTPHERPTMGSAYPARRS